MMDGMTDVEIAWLEAQLDLTHPDYRTRFIKNVLDARGDGVEAVCSYCGMEYTGTHEKWCPCAGERANQEAVAMREP